MGKVYQKSGKNVKIILSTYLDLHLHAWHKYCAIPLSLLYRRINMGFRRYCWRRLHPESQRKL